MPENKENTVFESVATESGSYKTNLNKMFGMRKPWKKRNPKHVLSFMPGTVEKLYVKVGGRVKEGDRLMVFRAMKMNNNILSPMAGEIKKINVKAGENVPKDVIMIEFK